MTEQDIRASVAAWRAATVPAGMPAPRIRAALIDMDGTLYDSMPWHARAWHRMVTGLGIEADVDEFFAYEGMTGAATINLIFNRAYRRDATADEVRELYHLKTVYFNEFPPVAVMPGAQHVVRRLAESGICPVLVTGSGQSSLIGRLDTDYAGLFDSRLRVTARDVRRGKPDPEPYLRAMELAGVSVRDAIVIENAPLGVQSGHRSGAYTVAVTTGPIPAAMMSEAGADIIYPSMPALADGIDTLINELNAI